MNTESLALDFKSATLYAVRVVLHSAEIERLAAALDKRMADAGSFFENEPVVIDASRVDGPVDWTALLHALRGHNLPPIGVVAEGDNLRAAQAAGLTPVELSTPPVRPAAVDTATTPPPLPTQRAAALTTAPAPDAPASQDKSADAVDVDPASATAAEQAPGKDVQAEAGHAAPNPASNDGGKPDAAHAAPGEGAPDADASSAGAARPATPATSREPLPARAARATTSAPTPTPGDPQSSSALVISRPLRSGQRVYARHSDLVVIGMVSPGAEVIADGNVHVYGPLRGKAMAGARGDTSARIFTTHLDAELLAVAGVYRVVEDKLDATLHGQPALVRLDGDTLRIEALKA
ncbi:septum site-determining protein MinC [Bordetella flabilis]|uniref:Probable septum site-determining protein MinC n=1 Tax=Bordetella flabilis TaxID=463014 RepID=A0A193GHG7_9BORD|nr:septum site-determining protein MinC [Bordetella flabilis]ANN79270.1 septum site-determining protein MinC [Bordetella flabilis]